MAKQKIQLSDHFNYSRLLRFVLPCIGTMLFTSIYGVVDGLCVSNFVGKTAFAAVNLIMPLPMLIGTVGFMLGTGGSAIVGITLGEGDQGDAHDGAAAGAQHEADGAQQHGQRHDEVDRRKGRFAHKVRHAQPIHDAVDGGEQHGADAGQHEPQQAGVGEMVR